MFRRSRSDEHSLPRVKCRPTTNPILPVAEMHEAIGFYERLGFEVAAYDENYAWVRHCGWEWCHLRKVESVAGNEASAYFHVDDAESWHQAFSTALDDPDAQAPASPTPWGKLEFSIVDPAGNLLRFGSPA